MKQNRAARPIVLVGIAGGSGSGKTWLVQQLAPDLAPSVVCLSMDDFYLDHSGLSAARRARLNFDHPHAIDWWEFEQAVHRLQRGDPAAVPNYDFCTHCRQASRKVLRPKPIVLVDGLWSLRRPSLRRLYNVRIFLGCSAETRLRRRLERDLKGRGRTRRSVCEQFRRTVEPMHRQFVEPQQKWADIVLREGWGAFEARVLAEVIRSRCP